MMEFEGIMNDVAVALVNLVLLAILAGIAYGQKVLKAYRDTHVSEARNQQIDFWTERAVDMAEMYAINNNITGERKKMWVKNSVQTILSRMGFTVHDEEMDPVIEHFVAEINRQGRELTKEKKPTK